MDAGLFTKLSGHLIFIIKGKDVNGSSIWKRPGGVNVKHRSDLMGGIHQIGTDALYSNARPSIR